MDEGHLTEELLARLAEGQGGDPDLVEAREHLMRCRRCHAAYADAIRFRSQWLHNSGAFAAEVGSLEEGIAAGADSRDHPFVPEPAGVPIRRRLPLFLRPLPAAVAGAVLFSLLAVLIAVSPFWNRAAVTVESSIVAIESALLVMMEQGLVLPGPEVPSRESQVTYRSGAAAAETLDQAIAILTRRYEDGDPSPETAYWLVVGHLAAGQIQAARVVAAAARRAHPNDVRLLIAQGVLAYRESHLTLARSLFDEALSLESYQAEATFNRGLVRAELGDPDGARQDLQAVALRDADRPIGQRAARELERLPSLTDDHPAAPKP